MEPTPSRPFVFVTTTELQNQLSEIMSRAVYGNQLIGVKRRGNKIAAIVSFEDVVFLERMKRRREEVRNAPLPTDPEKIGAAIAKKYEQEMLFF